MKKSPKIIKELNDHYNLNFQLGIEYLALSQKMFKIGMLNLADYIKTLAEDKLTTHKDKLFYYLIDQDINIENNFRTFDSSKFQKPLDVVEHILEQEGMVKEKILEISKLSLKEDDHESFHFLTWFVNDGVKDYNEVKNIRNLFNLTDDILSIDQAIKELGYTNS